MRTAGVDVDDARYDEDESMLYAEFRLWDSNNLFGELYKVQVSPNDSFLQRRIRDGVTDYHFEGVCARKFDDVRINMVDLLYAHCGQSYSSFERNVAERCRILKALRWG